MNNDNFYSGLALSYTVLAHILKSTVVRYTDRIVRLFVPKFYHDRKDTNFLIGLVYVGGKKKLMKNFFLKPHF